MPKRSNENKDNNLSSKRLALIATDLHLRPEHYGIAISVLDKLFDTLTKANPEYLFLLGDIFHFKNTLHASMLDLFRLFLRRTSEHFLSRGLNGPRIVIVVGNHDWGIQYKVHSLQQGFADIPGVVIVDTVFKLDDQNGFMAYAREKDRFRDMLASLMPVKRLFGHFDLAEFMPGSGWEERELVFSSADFEGLQQVFSGHLHLAQEKVFNGTEIVMVGSPATVDHGESDQNKRFVLIDLNTGKYESINTGLTLHKTLRVTLPGPLPMPPEEDLKKGVDFRTIVTGTKEQFAVFDRPKGYPAKIVPDFVGSTSSRLEIRTDENRDDVFKKYVNHELKRQFGEKINESGLDEEKLVELGLKYFNRAAQK